MGGAIPTESHILHTVTGRMRIHLSAWSGQGKRALEQHIGRLPGIRTIQASALTGNVLIVFDPTTTNEQAILQHLQVLELETLQSQAPEPAPPPAARMKAGTTVRARIAVRGLDRDPSLAQRVIEQLEKRSGVRVHANLLTGRVLVEFEEHQADLEDLLSEVADLELPDLPDEDRPTYPLDPGPLIQSFTRTLGAAIGLSVLATRRLAGTEEALPGARVAIHAAALIGILQGIPPVRFGLRRLLGRTTADLLVNVPAITALTFAGSLLGLTVTGTESLRLLTEVRARQEAWKKHEERIERTPLAQPNARIRLENGERVPLAAEVLEGTGTATGRDGMPISLSVGAQLPPGARVYGGPFTIRLKGEESFTSFIPSARPSPLAPTLFDHYQRVQAPLSLAFAGLTAVLTRSFSSTLASLLLVGPRPALIGMEHADLSANARVLRAGITVVGTRPERTIRLPKLLLLDGARLLTDGLEVVNILPLSDELSASATLNLASGIASAAGSPWGGIFHITSSLTTTSGSFDGARARALVDGVQYNLGPVENWGEIPEAARLRQRGNYILALHNEQTGQMLALIALRPRLAPGVQELHAVCNRYGVELALLAAGDQLAVRALVHRTNVTLMEHDDALQAITESQQQGALVAFVSDNARAAAGFAACDLAIGLTDDRNRLSARADLLAPDLAAVAAIVETGAKRDTAARDAVVLSGAANLAGLVWGIGGIPGIERASRVTLFAALGAIADSWLRLHGGERARSTIARLVDPQPERWGRQSIADVLRALETNEQGLSSAQALARRRHLPLLRQRHVLGAAILDQLRSPLTGILAAGAGLSLLLGSTGDVVIIGATIAANVLVSVWQEQKADRVAETLRQIGVSQARVLRDRQEVLLPANELVRGDILLLAPGDRVAADARVIEAQSLVIDEAALTGESFPATKLAEGGNDAGRIVLEGTDVTTGSGQAVVVAVGEQTRMGALRQALAEEEKQLNPLGVRLGRMLRFFLPISTLGGATVIGAGLLWGKPLAALLATGATVALAGVPEGLPVLSRVGEAGVAHRLAQHQAVVRRLSSVEALGRVDVACTDKTGTMTRGRLQLGLVATLNQETTLRESLPEPLAHVLLTAALASPRPDEPGAFAHPTDRAVVQGAVAAGLAAQLTISREAELPFDPVRSFHATIVQKRLCIKGAPEMVLPRCRSLLVEGVAVPLDEEQRTLLSARALQLAERGLRVLMVAEGTRETTLENPRDLTFLGFLGMNDPLRPTVRAAVERCQEAGVRVIMITGDHPATARAIAQEAGLLRKHGEIINARDLAELQNGDLDQRLKNAAVIARATPLDKVRIVESLRRQGHTVAMTGDGVNDAPALRLADIGVAMGKSGTEVARQTADVILTDDDFSTLVEGLVEGRSFWRNTRRALGLLLGGNLGELGLVLGASLLGIQTPLTVRQILAVNAITDVLPALAVILQQPEHRDLAQLKREGVSALDAPLRNEITRRGLATALPSLAAYLLALRTGSLPHARSVACTSVVVTQLAQTLMVGRAEGHLTRPVSGAVAGSGGVLLAALTLPQLRTFLQLVPLSPTGWLLSGSATLAAVLLSTH